MKKIILTLCALVAAFILVPAASAQQTLSEATDSIKSIYKKAQAGDPQAMTIVGSWYYQGKHVDRDYTKAAQWWSKAAKEGDNNAIGFLGLCYQTGHGVKADSIRAFGLYNRSIKAGNKRMLNSIKESADKGNLFSLTYLAQCYQKGIGTKADVYKAAKLYEVAAAKGSIDACRELGVMLLNNKKASEAVAYFKKGAEKDDLACTYYLGKLLLEGRGTTKDETQGIIYLQKAADNGFANAQLTLGRCYYNGAGVRKSPETGFGWLRKASINPTTKGDGPSNAMFDMAQKLVAGDGCALDYENATDWFGESVIRNHSKSFRKLFEADGALYNSPYLTYLHTRAAIAKADFDGALKLAKQLEKSKTAAISATGLTLQGMIYANKNYAKRDLKKAVKLLTKASDKGNAQAKYTLGVMYETGTGVEKDLTKAADLIAAAAKAGDADALCYLGSMYYEGRGIKQDYAKAVKCFSAAGPLLSESAAKLYASCYENGYGGLKADPKKAEEILKNFRQPSLGKLLNLIPAAPAK